MPPLKLYQRGRQTTWAHVSFESATADRFDEGLIVTFDVIRVCGSVVADCFVKLIAAAQIPRNHCRISRLVVRACESHPAESGIPMHHSRRLGFDSGRNLHVA